MRLIAGTAKGRRLKTPRQGTRPLTGKAREAVFSMLGSRVVAARVLDLYAGSGSLGLEALSRGAADAVFVERSREAARVLRDNVTAVGLGGSVVADDVARFLRSDVATYDLVFVDPPFAEGPEDVDAVLAALDPRLTTGGTIVVHRRTGDRPVAVEFPVVRDVRKYGDSTVFVLQKRSSE